MAYYRAYLGRRFQCRDVEIIRGGNEKWDLVVLVACESNSSLVTSTLGNIRSAWRSEVVRRLSRRFLFLIDPFCTTFSCVTCFCGRITPLPSTCNTVKLSARTISPIRLKYCRSSNYSPDHVRQSARIHPSSFRHVHTRETYCCDLVFILRAPWQHFSHAGTLSIEGPNI